jgi:hypothetical protein
MIMVPKVALSLAAAKPWQMPWRKKDRDPFSFWRSAAQGVYHHLRETP